MARKVLRWPRFDAEFGEFARQDDRLEEALRGFCDVVARIPEQGTAVVRDQPEFHGRPLHTAGGSFLIVYTFNQETVTLLAIKSVPQATF